LALPAGTNFTKINHFREQAGGEILVALGWHSAVSRIANPQIFRTAVGCRFAAALAKNRLFFDRT
jgi:hypothetical protein